MAIREIIFRFDDNELEIVSDNKVFFEEIVRCKDCKHRYVTGITTQYYVCDFMDAEYRDDGYCHRGERIDNE